MIVVVAFSLPFASGLSSNGPEVSRAITTVLFAPLFVVGLFIPDAYRSQPRQHRIPTSVASYFANIAQGYENYGFVYGFSSSVVGRGMTKPDDYKEETH